MAILLWLRINIGGIEVLHSNFHFYILYQLRINIGGIEAWFNINR